MTGYLRMQWIFEGRLKKHIQDVIHDMATPAWLGSVPHNFDHQAAGTLKADEW